MRPRKNAGWIKPFDPREVNNHSYQKAIAGNILSLWPQELNSLMGFTKLDPVGRKLIESCNSPHQSLLSPVAQRKNIASYCLL